MLVLIGESGSGKTTIEDKLIKEHGMKRAISHTSREKRPTDIEGVNYYFVSKDEMEKLYAEGRLVERIDYMGNIYGYIDSECQDDRTAVVVPEGFRQLLERNDLHVFSVYVCVPESVRRERMLSRGDSVESVEKRLVEDRKVFEGIADKVDLVVSNKDGEIDKVIDEILFCYDLKR